MKKSGWDIYREIKRVGERIPYHRHPRDKLILEKDEPSGSRAYFIRWLFWVRTGPAPGTAIVTIERLEIPRFPYTANTTSWGESYELSPTAINLLYERGVLYIPLSAIIK